ncbi:ATP-binding cassette domain-containing protein [Chitinispirillales bacterium ANBcel5]|uniref:ABC transporter ATP-binding protein n=1 Tax=Cellulosispirillum alkaliphilum TaxID=3039283 RepID=UPI002A4F8A91|nr:ATP-binding cassette domain-containing protein [Chitinispirillales bacterium ANBcel5]
MQANDSAFMLEVQNLHKKFGEVHAVKNLNFHIKKGEVFGFLGPNGAGKTTTMRIITCFIPPTNGTVLVDGTDTSQNNLQVRKKIGYLPENTPLYPDMTVKEYLNFVGEIRGLKAGVLKRRIDEMFTICNISQMSGRQIGKLSKGYRQRVGLAQAMMHDPDLLILDEPMSGLDPNQIVEIRNLIRRIGKEKTVIYCSHILSEVSATCDRLLIINEGSIVATGTPDELTHGSEGGSRYMLKIKGEKETIRSTMSQLPNINTVSFDASDGEWNNVEVQGSNKEEIGEELFKCVVDNGWSLAELRKESASLEEVFTQLTRG